MKKRLTRHIKNIPLRAWISVLFLLCAGSAVFAYSLLKDLPNPQRISERAVSESTKIYDRTGKILLYEIHGEEKRTVIPLSDIPEHLKQATLAAEDINFYTHGGIDIKGIIRAAAKNILGGNISQGGSTITQQLIKNSLLGSERTFRRKIREQILAILLEQKYSKDDILELYLNQIPYGSNAYGVSSAAQTFFAKDVRDLTLAETALLVSLPKAPTYYSPYGSHKDDLLQRRNWVLDHMVEAQFITRNEADQAKKEIPLFAPPTQSIHAPHFVMYVQEYLNKTYGEDFVMTGGLKVTTTLDWGLQEKAEELVRQGAEDNEKLVGAANASLVAIDPKSGDILAMVGSKNYWEKPIPEGCTPGVNCRIDPQVNIATRLRQPGSSFKPFVYASAFEKGYTPETTLFDVPTEFNSSCDPVNFENIKQNNTCYHPKNYDGKFRGPVTLRQSIAQSLNVPSVKVLYLAGINDVLGLAQQLGITSLTDPSRYGLSLVLGGGEVSLLEMTSAYGVFAQEGILHPKTSILRIEDSKGNILEEKKDSSLPVLDTEVARTLNDILSDNDARVPVFSPRSSLYFSDRQVAAKTGTTQDFRDAWVIGYTPSIVAGVWVGNNDNSPMKQNAVSIMVAGPMWHKFMESALQNSPPEYFGKPTPITPEKPILRGVYRSGPYIQIDKISKKRATENTPSDLIEEVGLGPVQSILSFVDRKNPLGPSPIRPSDDPQFINWQTAINAWLVKNPLLLPTVSQESDTIHTSDTKPKITLLSPDSKTVLTESPSTITLTIHGSFPIQEISLFIDDELISSKTSPILEETIRFPVRQHLSSGTHILKVSAFDIVKNRSELIETLNIQ